MPAPKSLGAKPREVFRDSVLSRIKVPAQYPTSPEAQHLEEFCAKMFPYYERAAHTRLLCQHLEAVERGEIQRLIINIPPRHSKSLHVSDNFPAWCLGRAPRRKIILASHTAALAWKSSRRCRDLFRDPLWPFPNAKLSTNVAGQVEWETASGGEFFAVGVGGAIPGRGADILIVDDPFPGIDEAESETFREKVWDWWVSDALPRLQPRGAVILCHTRWNEDDVVGRILDSGEASEWVVLRLPAICEEVDDPLGRSVGEALWSKWYPPEELARIKSRDSRVWSSQYQQRPSNEKGNMFHRDWWKRYDRDILMQKGLHASFIAVDSSFKDGVSNDYSVMAVWGMMDGRAYLMDLWRDKVEYPQLLDASRDVFAKWRVPLVIEDKASGQSLLQSLTHPSDDRSAIPAIAQPVERNQSKISRAERVTDYVEAGVVYLPKFAPWVQDFIEEHALFPQKKGGHDDQVDTTSIALRRLFLGSMREDEPRDFRYRGQPQPPTVRSRWLDQQRAQRQEEADEYLRLMEERDEWLRNGGR